ncbi:MAG TPA: thioesterase family protein [Actinomycetes bacterium]|jgi:hypothetical protein|nr:thioesterase family protein [Actinomycetes bacterium]
MPETFFLADGDRFIPTELTRGPWDPRAQHGGPPAALLGRAVEGHGERAGMSVARATFEFLRPVPIAPLELATTLLRGGRNVELVGASLASQGTEVMRVVALRIRTTRLDLPDSGPPPAGAGVPPGPEQGRPLPFFPTGFDVGYHTAMQWRFIEGSFMEPGPGTVWLRMRCPLLPGEEPSPLQRVFIAADSGNGVSGVLDWRRWLFINCDLTVYLQRSPVGEWVCLQARTTVDGAGMGLAESVISDLQGPVARGLQSLFVAERAGGAGSG